MIPGRLVTVKHGPGLCVLHHRPHELGRVGKGFLGVPQLPGQGVKAIHRRLGAGRKRLVISKPMFPEIQERGGHLLEVVNFGPPRIGRAFALGQPVLNVDDKIDAPGRGRALFRQLRDRALPGDHRPDVLRVKAGAQGGRAQAGGLILPRGKKRNDTAPATLYRKAGLLHEPQERRKVGGPFPQGLHDGKPYPLFGRGRTFPDPLPIVEKAALAVELRVLDHRQVMLQAHPVREFPQGRRRSEKVPEFPGTVQGGGVVVNVIMDVAAVCVGGNKKGVLALCPAHGRFIAYPVCLLRGDLPRAKGLPDLIAQHIRIPPLFPARDSLVFCLCQQELGVGGAVVALIGGNEFPALGFLRVLSIVKTVFQRLGNGFPLADMMGH